MLMLKRLVGLNSREYLSGLHNDLMRLRRQCITAIDKDSKRHTLITLKLEHEFDFNKNLDVSKRRVTLRINKSFQTDDMWRPKTDSFNFNVGEDYAFIHIENIIKQAINRTNKELVDIDFDSVVYTSVFEKNVKRISLYNDISEKVMIVPSLTFIDRKVIKAKIIIG